MVGAGETDICDMNFMIWIWIKSFIIIVDFNGLTFLFNHLLNLLDELLPGQRNNLILFFQVCHHHDQIKNEKGKQNVRQIRGSKESFLFVSFLIGLVNSIENAKLIVDKILVCIFSLLSPQIREVSIDFLSCVVSIAYIIPIFILFDVRLEIPDQVFNRHRLITLKAGSHHINLLGAPP